MSVVRRTFEAKKYPKGSPEWVRLQANALTSSYYPSRRYAVVDEAGKYVTSARTKAEALAIDEVNSRLAAPRVVR